MGNRQRQRIEMPAAPTNLKPAPKDLRENIAHRKRVHARCAKSEKYRELIWIRCSRSFVYFCDTMCYTYDPKTHPKQPNRPFILFGYQEEGARKILKAIGVHDLLIEKSRQMGVSWLLMAIFVWLWLFRPAQSFLLGSRKEDLVDKPGDSASLFWKLDYIIDRLPKWMRPGFDRTSKHYFNKENSSTIDGESTNDNFGRGSTKTAIDLDEFQAAENGHKLQDATQAATNCRLFVGTPNGAAGAYYDQRTKMLETTPERVLNFHWRLNPIYAAGLYSIEGCDKGSPPVILDGSYKFPENFNFLDVVYPQFKVRSPWFNEQCLRASSAQQVASELEIDYLQSGWQFFDPIRLKGIIDQTTTRDPVCCGELLRDPDWRSPKWLTQGSGGQVELWFTPPVDGVIPWDDIVIACDLASGSGGEKSSNSSASIGRRTTGEKIGELTSNLINPTEFAYYVLGLCVWFNNALLNWERNGPNGAQFGKVIKDSGYRNIYYQTKDARFDRVQAKEPGWWTDNTNKPVLLGGYAEALFTGRFTNPNRIALLECGHYVQNANKIEHSRSLAGATEDPTAIGESHGDRVIADALLHRTMQDKGGKPVNAPPTTIPPNCALARRQQREQRARMTEAW